jgi:predicted nucleotide-binding protein
MKRDMDLIRELLLKLEALTMRPGGIAHLTPDAVELQVDGYNVEQIDYHLSLMKSSGWIDNGGVNPMVGIGFRALTPAGHNLLDSLTSNLSNQPRTTMDPARSQHEIERGIARLQERIEALRAVDVTTVEGFGNAELSALSASIKGVLERCFGANTPAHARFRAASSLRALHHGPKQEMQAQIAERIKESIALLEEAKRELREDIEDAHHASHQPLSISVPISRRVFVVHGHDGEARETVARFLEKIDFEAIILHEQANKGRTVIEKIEANSDVGFAVVLLTPDDVGRSVKEEQLEPRARQNVLLELGYFIGLLGRGRVCALKHGSLDIPSDFAGVVWEAMDAAGAWKNSLCRELDAAGFEIDWKKAMQA